MKPTQNDPIEPGGEPVLAPPPTAEAQSNVRMYIIVGCAVVGAILIGVLAAVL